MTQVNTTISYAGPSTPQSCPLCRTRPTWKKTLYGHHVCKKCYYGFANRRQIAYILDAILFAVIAVAIIFPLSGPIAAVAPTELGQELLFSVIGLALGCLFVMKDGFGGQSPGKRIAGVQVLDESSRQPISFVQSFKRNAILLIGQVPIVGRFGGLIVVIMLAIQMNKGYRTGDRFARTRVIWKKYARSPIFGGDGLLCNTCGYDLTGNQSGICPECGTPLSPQQLAPAMAVIPPMVTR